MSGAPVAAVEARGFGWRYATRKAWAVRGLDLRIEPGERVLLLGRSGAGKSTLLAGLAGLLVPTTAGHDEHGTGEQEGTLAVHPGAGQVGLLLQDPLAQTVLARCGDDVAFGLENHAVPEAEIWPRVDAALAAVRFPYGRDHPTAQLSGGERQRLALAGVLALRPQLILLDEPTAMLDPDGADALRATIAEQLAATRATCVLVEHRVGPWLPLVDRVVVLEPGGGVVADGSPDDVLRARGAELAEDGVWVPGFEPVPRPRPPAPARGDHGPAHRSPAENGAPVHDHRGGGGVVLRARGLAASRRKGAPVVQDVDLDLEAGRALCITGPNGAGKSTLALTLAGLAAPEAGTVSFAGEDRPPHRWRPRELVTRIGTVFQEPQHQFVAATVADELAVGPRRVGLPEPEITRRVDDLLARLRLAPLARANPFTLSGGEQRRLSVATVLATRPKVLVLDEPTFGQDSRTWRELVELLLGLLDDGAGLVCVTHDRALVEALTAGGRGEEFVLPGRRAPAPVAAHGMVRGGAR